MTITTASIREPMPVGALRGALQADGTVLWYMPGDTLPADPQPSLAGLAATLMAKIDADVDAVYATVIGQRAVEYQEAEADAQAYKDAGYTGTVPPSVASWVTASGMTATAAANDILATAAAWRTAALNMRAARLGHKAQARSATTQQGLDGVAASWRATINAIRAALGLPGV